MIIIYGAELTIPIKFKFCGANFFKQSGKISASSLTKIFLRSIKFPIKHNLWKEFWQLKKIFFGGPKFLFREAELTIPIKFKFCGANF